MSYKPPKAVREAAEEGLELRRKHKRGGLSPAEASKLGIGSGVSRAASLMHGNVSVKTIKRMKAYFARHRKDKRGKNFHSKNDPSAGRIAWLLWGGDAGEKWVEQVLSEED